MTIAHPPLCSCQSCYVRDNPLAAAAGARWQEFDGQVEVESRNGEVRIAIERRAVHASKRAIRARKAEQERRSARAMRIGAQKVRVARYFARCTAAGVAVSMERPRYMKFPRASFLREFITGLFGGALVVSS